MADQDLKLTATAAGFANASGEVQKLTEAEQRLANAANQVGVSSVAAALGTDNLGVSLTGVGRLVGTINPELGSLINQINAVQASAGDGGASIAALNSTLGKLGAATVAAVGFAALSKSIAEVSAQMAKMREEMKSLRAEQTKLDQGNLAAFGDIKRASRGRREGRFSDSELAKAEGTFTALRNAGRVEDLGALQNNIVGLSSVVSPQDIEALSIAGVEIDPTRSRAGRERQAQRALSRQASPENVERILADQRSEKQRRAAAALSELGGQSDPTVGTANLDNFIKEFAPNLDRGSVIDIAGKLRESRDADARSGSNRTDVQRLEQIRKSRRGFFGTLFDTGVSGGTPGELQAGTRLLNEVNNLSGFVGPRSDQEVLKEKADYLREHSVGGPSFVGPPGPVSNVTQHIYQQNARHYGSDAAAWRGRVRNGETRNE